MATKKQAQGPQSPGDEERIQEILVNRQAMAEALHGSTSRVEAEEILAPVFTADETTQMALLKRLARERDIYAADILLAIHELAPQKNVRKEARRALILLAGAKVFPSWTPESETSTVGLVAHPNPPRFWKGSVTMMRESGELQLTLCWEQGFEYGEACLISFVLDFWREGVKDFFTDVGSRRHVEERLDAMRTVMLSTQPEDVGDTLPEVVSCTLAEGRRLLNDALSVNQWRKVKPHKDYRQNLTLVQSLILHAFEVGEDSGQSFIAHDLEPDLVVANFAGAWAMGDYSLCYDLLASNSQLREGRERQEWIDMRRAWADEAHPAHFDLYYLHEHKQAPQSKLWLPSSVLSKRSASEQKEIEMLWSLQLADTPLSGTLPEMPMGTAVYKETGRHWFWSIFVVEQQSNDDWRIVRMNDEGLALQGLTMSEIRKRSKEYDESLQKIMREHKPTDSDAQEYLDEIVGYTWKLVSLQDALLMKNPLDKAAYEDAYGRAMTMGAVERAAVYANQLLARFPNDPDRYTALQRVGALQIAQAERFSDLGQEEQAQLFETRGEETLRSGLNESEPMGYLLLAEFLISREKYAEAQQELLIARGLADTREIKAQVEYDLAQLALERNEYVEARSYFERVAEIAPDYPDLWLMLGSVERQLENFPECEVYYKRAIEETPEDVRPYSEMAAIYVDHGDLDKARDLLVLGMRNVPQSAQLPALLATVYLHKKDRPQALKYLAEAEHLNPNLELVQAVRELVKK